MQELSDGVVRTPHQRALGRPNAHATTRQRRTAAATAALLSLPVIAISLCFWPGHMTVDTLAQIQELSSGFYSNWSAPLLLAIWHPFWQIGIGTGWVLTAQIAAVTVGGYMALHQLLKPLWAALAMALVAFSPPVVGMLGFVGRDVWYTAALILGFAAAVRSSHCSGQRRLRWLFAGLVAAWAALAARQNAVFGVVVLAAALVALSPVQFPGVADGRTWRRALSWAAGGVLVTLALMATQFGMSRAVNVIDVHPTQYTFGYDLAALSEAEHRNLLPANVLPDRSMRPIDRHWSVDTSTTLFWVPGAPLHLLSSQEEASLADAWRREVTHHPFTYLGVRGRLWLRQVSLTRRPAHIYPPGIPANKRGLHARFSALDDAAKSYIEAFAADDQLDGGVVHLVVVYLLLALAGTVVFLRNGHPPALVVIGALCLSSLTYQVGLFFGATGVQYRFEFPTVVIGLVALVALAAHAWRTSRHEGRDAESPL